MGITMTTTEGEINPQILYRLDRAMEISGLGAFAMKTARKHGLEVVYVNRKAYVMGSELIDYLVNRAPRTPPANLNAGEG